MAMLNNQMVYCHVQLMLIHFQREGVKNEGLQSGEPISATKSFDLPNIGVTNIPPFICTIYIYNIYIYLTISTIDVWGAPILTPMPSPPSGPSAFFQGVSVQRFRTGKAHEPVNRSQHEGMEGWENSDQDRGKMKPTTTTTTTTRRRTRTRTRRRIWIWPINMEKENFWAYPKTWSRHSKSTGMI